MHPSLCVGMCCICYGTLTADNTLYDDLYEGRGGVHKGVCAIEAGIYPDLFCELTCEALIRRMHAEPDNRSPRWYDIHREYYNYVRLVATEDHYDMSGP